MDAIAMRCDKGFPVYFAFAHADPHDVLPANVRQATKTEMSKKKSMEKDKTNAMNEPETSKIKTYEKE